MSDEGSDQQLQTGIIVLYSLQAAVYLIFLGFYIRRVNKLDKLASSTVYLTNDRTLKIRIAILILLIVMYLIHIFLSELDQNYWMYQYKNYSLIDLLGIVDFLLQIYIIIKEHKKKAHRTKSLIILWGVLTIILISLIVVVEIFIRNIGIILLIFEVLALVVLTALGLALDNTPVPDIETFNLSLRQSKLLPIVGDAERASFSEFQKIYIEFNKDFEVNINGEKCEFFFKIAVYVNGQSHIITKN